MPQRRQAPYGSWKSPITSEMIASGTFDVGRIQVDGRDLYWVELRPAEQGRYVVVRRTEDGQIADVTPHPFNARTRVHEYGGGAYLVVDGTVYFSNFADQRLYRQTPGGEPQPITPEAPMRYADGVFDRRRGRLICVREDHTASDREPANTLVAIDPSGDDGGEILVSGNDFYAWPRISPDGTQLAWVAWNHPNMPWDGTHLWVAGIREDGFLDRPERVAGDRDESVFQPECSPDGVLHFVSDRSGWWNLYRACNNHVEALTEMEVEFGRPLWSLGTKTYTFESADCILCAFNEKGTWRLARLNTATRAFDRIEIPFTDIEGLELADGQLCFVGASPKEPPAIVRLDLATQQTTVLRRSTSVSLDDGYLTAPTAIEFPTEDGLTAHAFFYPPNNRDHEAPAGERPPPLVAMGHGGPTGATSSGLRFAIQYWTSRGIAVLDVNYGGSTGYGRAYRQRLQGQWGVVDVDDCVNGARYLVEQGLVDGERLAIRGGSAGGYTTLSALTFRDTFKAGASYYGVSDLEALAKETHKFESRYLDGLVGPYPDRRDVYIARSPIHHVDRLSCPLIFFQGLEDKIVPPNQAEMMVDALRAKGLPVAYVPFEGEQHGFRRAETLKRALDSELYFYSRVFGFAMAEPVEPVAIENLESD